MACSQRTLRPALALWVLFLAAPLGACGTTDDGVSAPVVGFIAPVTATGTGTLAAGAVSLDGAPALVVADGALRAPLGEVPSLDELTPGAIVYSADAGFLRRVVRVDTEGREIVVATEPASLAELFEEADFGFRVGEPGVGVSKAASPAGGDTTVDIHFDETSLYDSGDGGDRRLSIMARRGSLVGSPSFLANFVFSHTHVHLAQIQSSGFLRLDLLLEIEASARHTFKKEKEIPLLERSTIVFVGPVPIHLTPYVKLVLEGEVSAEGRGKATTGLTATLPMNHALKYHDIEGDDWVYTAVNRYTLQPVPMSEGELEASVTGKLTVQLEVGVKVYQQASLAVALGPYAELDVELLPSCRWDLKAGLAGQLTAKLESIGPWEEQEKTWDLYERERSLASGACMVAEPGFDAGGFDAGGLPDLGEPAPVDAHGADIPGEINQGEDVYVDPSLVHDGNVIASSNAQLAVLSGKVAVTGQVFISGAVDDLSPLAELRQVGGNFEMQDSRVTSLQPLARLERVDGLVQVRDNLSLLSTAGLSSLRRAGSGFMVSLVLGGAARPSRIEDLDALEEVGPWFAITADEALGFASLRRVDGDVSVDVVALVGLDQLTEITGALSLGPGLAGTGGFAGLARVGGDLRIDSAAVPAFPSLAVVAQGIVVGSDVLTVLSGFPALGAVAEPATCEGPYASTAGIVVEGCSALTRLEGFPVLSRVGCGGSLKIRQNPVLTTIDAFGGLLEVEGLLQIELNPQLRTIRGFGALTEVRHDFVIRANAALESIGRFSALTRVGCEVTIAEHPALVDAGAFSSLSAFWMCGWSSEIPAPGPSYCSVTFRDNPALVSLPEFSNLTDCNTIRVSGCDTLSHFNGLGALTHVGLFEASGNAGLPGFGGLDSLSSAGGVSATGNPSLTSFSGLNSLTEVGSLWVEDNDALVSLSGLGGLSRVQDFVFFGNDTISSLGGLFAAATVGYVRVEDNASLDQCEVEAWFEGLAQEGGYRPGGFVEDNGGQHACP